MPCSSSCCSRGLSLFACVTRLHGMRQRNVAGLGDGRSAQATPSDLRSTSWPGTSLDCCARGHLRHQIWRHRPILPAVLWQSSDVGRPSGSPNSPKSTATLLLTTRRLFVRYFLLTGMKSRSTWYGPDLVRGLDSPIGGVSKRSQSLWKFPESHQ